MIHPAPWTDGYIVAVAWHAVFNYRFSWDRLQEFDHDLSVDEIDDLLTQVREAGNPVGPDTPRQLPSTAGIEEQLARLHELIERTRRAVGEAFAGPDALPDQIFASCRFPRMYMTLPDAALAARDEVELIHLGDLPSRAADWQQRARLVEYSNLQAVTLFNMQLGLHGIGIELARLPHLRCLDLRENAFDAVPVEVLQCASLQWLDLGANALTALPDLSTLPQLAFLRIAENRISKAALGALRQRRPDLTIDAGA